MYTGSIQRGARRPGQKTKRERQKEQPTTQPKKGHQNKASKKQLYPPEKVKTIPYHLQPNQDKKSNKEFVLFSMYTFAQDQRLQRKEDFILRVDRASSPNAILFLTRQIVQNMQRGAAIHTLLHFLPTNESCQERRASLIE